MWPFIRNWELIEWQRLTGYCADSGYPMNSLQLYYLQRINGATNFADQSPISMHSMNGNGSIRCNSILPECRYLMPMTLMGFSRAGGCGVNMIGHQHFAPLKKVSYRKKEIISIVRLSLHMGGIMIIRRSNLRLKLIRLLGGSYHIRMVKRLLEGRGGYRV